MNGWIENKIKGYYDWLYNNTSFSHDDMTGWYSVQTPFIGLMNDCIELYIKKDGQRIVLSDDGDTISNLEYCGVNVSRSPNLKEILRKTELAFGVSIRNGEISAEATESNFNLKKHALICAIQQVSDLKAPGRKDTPLLLSNEVKTYLENNDIVYTQGFVMPGRRLNFNFDFQIAGKKEEMVIKTFNSVNQFYATLYLFGIEEIRNLRQEQTGKGLKSLVIANEKPKDEIISALEDYECELALWPEQGKTWNKDIFRIA